jgi:hypothetical protein
MRRGRAFALLALAMIALACRTDPVLPDTGPLPDAGHPVVEIGTRASGAVFTPWHDGDAIEEQWGPQGGVMVTPAVAIDGMLIAEPSPALDVLIQNYTLPDRAPLGSFPILGPTRALFARLDTRLVDGPIFDQIGWSDMTGRRLLIRARVSGMGIDATGEVEIVVGMPLSTPQDAGAFDGTGDAG